MIPLSPSSSSHELREDGEEEPVRVHITIERPDAGAGAADTSSDCDGARVASRYLSAILYDRSDAAQLELSRKRTPLPPCFSNTKFIEW